MPCRAARIVLLAVLTISPAVAQEESAPTVRQPAATVEADGRRLLAALDAAASDPAMLRARRVAAMSVFLDRHQERSPAHPLLLQVRLRLAGEHLRALDLETARAHFEAVASLAPTEPRDLRARALYGQAQVHELLGDAERARALLHELERRHAGERYARYAAVALSRLRQGTGTSQPWAGRPAPEFEPRQDRSGRSHSLATLQGRSAALVFWSPDAPEALPWLRRLHDAWRVGGGDPDRLLLFVSAPATAPRITLPDDLAALPFLPCRDEFLDEVPLRYRITRMPSFVLIGPDGTVLGRDFAPGEVERMLLRLR